MAFRIEAPIDRGRLAVAVPGVRMDLRLSAAKMIPVYRWDARPERGRLDSGLVRLLAGMLGLRCRPGSGHRSTRGGRTGVPHRSQRSAAEGRGGERLGRLDIEGRTGRRGFFQLTGLRDGRYRLNVRQDGASATVDPVEVEADAETMLEELTLSPPLTAEIVVDPPPGSLGEPWMARLFPRVPRVQRASRRSDGHRRARPVSGSGGRVLSPRGPRFSGLSPGLPTGGDHLRPHDHGLAPPGPGQGEQSQSAATRCLRPVWSWRH